MAEKLLIYKNLCRLVSILLVLLGLSKCYIYVEYHSDIIYVISLSYSIFTILFVGIFGIINTCVYNKKLATIWVVFLIYLLFSVFLSPIEKFIKYLIFYDIDEYTDSFDPYAVATNVVQAILQIFSIPIGLKYRKFILLLNERESKTQSVENPDVLETPIQDVAPDDVHIKIDTDNSVEF